MIVPRMGRTSGVFAHQGAASNRAGGTVGSVGLPLKFAISRCRTHVLTLRRSIAAAGRRRLDYARCRACSGSRAAGLLFAAMRVCRPRGGTGGGNPAPASASFRAKPATGPGSAPDFPESLRFCLRESDAPSSNCKYSANGIGRQPLFEARAVGTDSEPAVSDNSNGLSQAACSAELTAAAVTLSPGCVHPSPCGSTVVA